MLLNYLLKMLAYNSYITLSCFLTFLKFKVISFGFFYSILSLFDVCKNSRVQESWVEDFFIIYSVGYEYAVLKQKYLYVS